MLMFNSSTYFIVRVYLKYKMVLGSSLTCQPEEVLVFWKLDFMPKFQAGGSYPTGSFMQDFTVFVRFYKIAIVSKRILTLIVHIAGIFAPP